MGVFRQAATHLPQRSNDTVHPPVVVGNHETSEHGCPGCDVYCVTAKAPGLLTDNL